jgi:hypothetical protein
VSPHRTARTLAAGAATALVMAACSASDDASSDHAPTTPEPTTAGWREEVAARCAEPAAEAVAIQPSDGSAAGIAAEATAAIAVLDGPSFESIAVPSDVQPTLDQVVEMAEESRNHFDTSVERARAGDTAAAQRARDEGFDRLAGIGTAWAMAGAPCGFADPARVANADLTVPLAMDPNQIGAGFDSIWASEGLADRVVRLDPDTGEVQATIDVGDMPLKLQPADGSMWVRTALSYDAIDPGSNTVTATLAKADVGPSANRSWAVDGAMWICDGRRLHRYDPTSLARVVVLDLELECGSVWADDDLVVAWSYNEDDGQSGTSMAAFVDPATNTVLATVALPVDVGGPAVLPGSVFFPGYGGSTAAVVDRATWTVSATPDLGVAGGGSGQPASDGESIYVSTSDRRDVIRVDSTTFTVTDTIEPLGVNALLVDNGALWVAAGVPSDIVQRFDLVKGR